MFINCGQTALIQAKTFDKRLSRNILLHRHPRRSFAYLRNARISTNGWFQSSGKSISSCRFYERMWSTRRHFSLCTWVGNIYIIELKAVEIIFTWRQSPSYSPAIIWTIRRKRRCSFFTQAEETRRRLVIRRAISQKHQPAGHRVAIYADRMRLRFNPRVEKMFVLRRREMV